MAIGGSEDTDDDLWAKVTKTVTAANREDVLITPKKASGKAKIAKSRNQQIKPPLKASLVSSQAKPKRLFSQLIYALLNALVLIKPLQNALQEAVLKLMTGLTFMA